MQEKKDVRKPEMKCNGSSLGSEGASVLSQAAIGVDISKVIQVISNVTQKGPQKCPPK